MCFCHGIVLGDIAVGGLVGSNHDKILSCYVVADVGGHADVGELAAEIMVRAFSWFLKQQIG